MAYFPTGWQYAKVFFSNVIIRQISIKHKIYLNIKLVREIHALYKKWKNMYIRHGCPHLQLKQTRIFRLTKGHNSKTEKVEKSEIKQWSLVVEHKFQ
jgi:hypothetical protein